jgi:hypothetical protein
MMTDGRWRAAVVATLVAATAALAGCGDSGADTVAPASQWQEPSRYSFVLDSTCGERALIGRFRIMVEQGRVTKVEGLDESAQRALEGGRNDIAPTLRQLLQELDSARRAGAEVADITTDPADGYPTKITIDPAANSTDDESCYAITEFST